MIIRTSMNEGRVPRPNHSLNHISYLLGFNACTLREAFKPVGCFTRSGGEDSIRQERMKQPCSGAHLETYKLIHGPDPSLLSGWSIWELSINSSLSY